MTANRHLWMERKCENDNRRHMHAYLRSTKTLKTDSKRAGDKNKI